MHEMQPEDIDGVTTGRLGQVCCALSIALVSGAIIHNAVFGQETRVFSQSRVSISADATKLDKLFSVLNKKQPGKQSGRTRLKVRPAVSQPDSVDFAGDRQVLRAQRELLRLGEYSGHLDGVLGPDTLDAIRRYQRNNGLPETGQPDQQFIEHLEFVRHIQEASTITGSIAFASDESSVERAQKELRRLGYDPGSVDGRMGAKTTQALQSFQTDMRLPVDGKISPAVLELLASTAGTADPQ